MWYYRLFQYQKILFTFKSHVNVLEISQVGQRTVNLHEAALDGRKQIEFFWILHITRLSAIGLNNDVEWGSLLDFNIGMTIAVRLPYFSFKNISKLLKFSKFYTEICKYVNLYKKWSSFRLVEEKTRVSVNSCVQY